MFWSENQDHLNKHQNVQLGCVYKHSKLKRNRFIYVQTQASVNGIVYKTTGVEVISLDTYHTLQIEHQLQQTESIEKFRYKCVQTFVISYTVVTFIEVNVIETTTRM